LNRDSDAVATYKKAVQVDSTDMEIRVFMGVQFYYNKKRYEECVATLLPVLKKANPQSKHYSEAIKYAAFSYDLLGKTDMALEAYQNALKQSPDNMDFIFNLGRVYAMKNDYEKSLECFQKVLQSQPNDFDANLQMGYLNFQAKKFKDAVTYFEKTTQIQPDNPDGWDGLYRTYANLGDKAKATEAFEKTEALKKAKGQ
jgi:tetratricopeptide (TPR) repeat protein